VSAPRLAGVRLRPGEPLRWCACELSPTPGALVLVELEDGPRVGRVVVAPDQLLDAADPQLSGRVLREATAEERAAWEAERVKPVAGPALAREIEQIPPGAQTG
jgi:hypothetical protein